MKWPLILIVLFTLTIPLPGAEAATEYNEDVQAVVDRLQEITKRARQERAADRWLLRDLEDLIDKYAWPWRTELLYEDFSDGDYTNEPHWEPASGEFWVDASLGLRSRVHRAQSSYTEPQKKEKSKKQDLGSALLGALLDEALRPQDSNKRKTEPQTQRRGGPVPRATSKSRRKRPRSE